MELIIAFLILVWVCVTHLQQRANAVEMRTYSVTSALALRAARHSITTQWRSTAAVYTVYRVIWGVK